MFTDKCVLHVSARSQHVYSWVKQNPHFFEQVAQHLPHVLMWAAVTSKLIIGPHFFGVPVTDDNYLELLSHYLILNMMWAFQTCSFAK
jgi:hypothetical protein